MKKNHIQLNTDTFDSYIKHLKGMDYDSMMNGAAVIVRQVANDLKDVYLGYTPKRASGGRTGKYGAMPGNLQKSLRVFPKRRRVPFVIEFSVGFKKYGDLQSRTKRGNKAFDGYYDFMLNQGVEGRQIGPSKGKQKHRGFIQQARLSANRVIDGELSERATNFIHRRMAKDLGWKAPSLKMVKMYNKKYA